MPRRSQKQKAAAVSSLMPAESPSTVPDLTRWADEAVRRIRAALLAKRPPGDDELEALWEEFARLTVALLPTDQSAKYHHDWLDAQGHRFSQQLTRHVLSLLEGMAPPAQLSPNNPAEGSGATPAAGGEPAAELLALVREAEPSEQGNVKEPAPAVATDDVAPDGPFDVDGFRFAGLEVRFGKAGKQYRLVMALWDAETKRPAPPRPVEDVIADVWGNENDTEDSAFRQLCADTRARFQKANCPLDIRQLNAKVQLLSPPQAGASSVRSAQAL